MISDLLMSDSLLTANRTHSVRKLLIGFANAALTAWKLIVINAINIAEMPAIAKTFMPISIRYA